jgi:DNA replication protein DnaC
LPFEEWTETFGTERLTGALLDRLAESTHVYEHRGSPVLRNAVALDLQ